MNNPYVILGIKETADAGEIRRALKKQVDLYCSGNESRKNSDGEYLKEMFVQAARDLLNPVQRIAIDKELAKSREEHALEVRTKPVEEKKNTTSKVKVHSAKEVGKKVEINKKSKVNVSTKEKVNVKDVDVCVYNEDCIGLFRKFEWLKDGILFGEAGIIYVGIDSDKLGIKSLVDSGINTNYFVSAGERCYVNGKTYLANCTINDSIGFDDLRFKLFRSGIIGVFEMGKATPEEMLEVMCYAADYFKIDKNEFRK